MAGVSATIRPMGRPRGYRNAGSPASEIAMDPRSLDACNTHPCPTYPIANHPQVDVSTQVDLNAGVIQDWNRRATPMYSREDFKEQYCITSRQLDAVEKSGGGIFGCLSTKGPSPCSATRVSILSACVRSASSDENICDAPYPRKPFQIYYQQPYATYQRGFPRYDFDEDEWIESSYFRRRPTSFCIPDPKRYTWLSDDEESMRPEGPRPVLTAISQPPHSTIHKPKHVSFARSHTLTSFDIASRNRSPPRPHTQERLIDSQPTATPAMPPGSVHPYQPPEPKILVLEKTKKSAMKTQATQTELSAGFRKIPPVTLSPRTIHRVKMVSQGAQTNGFINGKKLTKSYSEAGQFGTPLGGGGAKEDGEHEPLQRTQSEEPPRSPFLVDTPPASPIKEKQDIPDHNDEPPHLSNGDIDRSPSRGCVREDEKEILIDFKPAPVSPDARAMLTQMPMVWKKPIPLQKTLSDGEIRIERRELVDEAGAPSYPHTCRRNYFDPWRAVRPPIQFSSTPGDLSLLRTCSPSDEHHEEEFHENIIRRGLFRKRSVSLEDGVQDLASGDYSLPRSLPTSPTSPNAHVGPRKVEESPRFEIRRPSFLKTFPVVGPLSPFASSDSLTNDVTKDHSDGIWNESQATVLQADSLALLTPSSRRRHLLLLQHQQRSSMDTEALDIEEEIDICPPSPRIHLEAPSNIVLPSTESTLITNGRPRSGLHRRSPGPLYSQSQSQSSSEIALSIGRTDSGRTNTTDLSEASTTEDYITANTSTGTGTATGTSTTTSSWSRPGAYQPSSSAAASAPASTTATAAEGSSFESASSIYSLARSEAVVEEPTSPKAILEELEKGFELGDIVPPSPARSTSSSSSGSYDLEDAMPDPYPTAPLSGHTSEAELEHDYQPQALQEYHPPSSGYTESPSETRGWTEEERRKRRKTFTLDFSATTDSDHVERPEIYLEPIDISPTPSHRHRPRSKINSGRSPYRNNKKRDSAPSPMSAISRSPQKEDWLREPVDDSVQIPTSDDSSCSHHYHLHHHHHHLHRDIMESGRHRRTRESPRRKTSSYLSTRRRSNEDKNAAITGSLPRRRTRAVDDICTSRLSPGTRYQRSPGHNGHAAVIVKSPSPETRLKAFSAESLRSVSPGSDSVFFSESAEPCVVHPDAHHCYNCGKEVMEEIVQPPAGFADSPEGPRLAPKHQVHRLYKKLDKRYRSEDRGERRYHRINGRSDIRAKSEERGRSSSRSSLEDGIRKRFHARSTDVSMETLAYREDEDAYVEPYKGNEWIYIGELEESHVWKRPDSRDGDDESSEGPIKDRRGSQGSTESEKCFRKKYQAATRRMVHRKSSGEMYKRIQSKSFEYMTQGY